MGHGAAVETGALVPVASTDSGVECGWDCMADKRLVYRKYSDFICEKQMKLLSTRRNLLLQMTYLATFVVVQTGELAPQIQAPR